MAKKFTKKRKSFQVSRQIRCRYGRKDRKLVADLEERMRAPHVCTKCARPTVKRIGTGIWKCSKCGHNLRWRNLYSLYQRWSDSAAYDEECC